MKRPLGALALLYGGGLLLGEAFQPPLTFLFALSITVALAALLWSAARLPLLWALVVLTGCTNLAWHTAVLSPHDLRISQGDAAEYVTIRGTLIETPVQRIFVRDEQESSRMLAPVRVSALQTGGGWKPAFGKIMAITPDVLPPEFFAGQNVEIAGVLAPPPQPMADGLFDYRAYLRRQGIHYQLRVASTRDWLLIEPRRGARPLTDRFLAWAQRTLARSSPEPDEAVRLAWAMTLGWRTALTNEVAEPFMRSGTMHIFAISGLHIALIAGILVSLLRVLQMSRAACGLIAIPLIWFYTAATGWQPSAVRASVMMTIIVGGWSLKRPTDLLNSLAAAALIILMWDPQQLFQASFQLSFFVVLSIALFLPPLEKVRDRLLAHDPLLPPELIPRWQRWFGLPLRWVLALFVTSLAAWLGSWPLTAYYFHIFSPVTLLANVLIVPSAGAALASNLGSLICGDWFPFGSELFSHSGWFWMSAMNRISQWAAQLPGGFFYVRAPAAPVFGIYYGLLVGVLSGWLLAPQRRVLAIAAVILAALFFAWQWQSHRREIVITALPLSGGASVFVDAPGTQDDWLIDTGNTNAVELVMKPFLRAQGVNHLPRLAITHGDLRHMGGAQWVSELFSVRECLTSSVRFRSPAYRRLVQQLEHTPERHRLIHRGDQLGHWTVLHPCRDDNFSQGDDNALVLRAEFHGTRILLLSDLGRPGQEALLQRETDLRADIVLSGLPEQTDPLGHALLHAIAPKAIVILDSEFPATKRANAKLRERVERRGVPVIYTRTAGAVTVTIRPGGWELRTSRGERLASRDACAVGTDANEDEY